MEQNLNICKAGIWNDTIPGITFDENGFSNYFHLHKSLEHAFPRGEEGNKIWEKAVESIKSKGKNNTYDCIIGVSGGVDSSYLLHLAKNVYGLRPLAVNLDNGFNSDIAVKNIQKITKALNIDLETYVIDYNEIKDLMYSYMKASLPWIDTPTDLAIKSVMYKVAKKEKIKFILRGNDFRSEGKQPREWTYSDLKQLKYVHKNFGRGVKLKTYPVLSIFDTIYLGYINKIKEVRPFYYNEYKKQEAKEFLMKAYDWQDYGGHHHENIFTKYAMSFWLPRKFGIDKRLINLSAQVVSGAISRNEALLAIERPFDSEENLNQTEIYVKKKLDINDDDYRNIWNSPNKTFLDYPNNFKFYEKILKYGKPIISLVFKQKPMSFFEMENRMQKDTNSN